MAKVIRGDIRSCELEVGKNTDLFTNTSMNINLINEEKSYVIIKIIEYGLFNTSEQYILKTRIKKCPFKLGYLKDDKTQKTKLYISFKWDHVIWSVYFINKN